MKTTMYTRDRKDGEVTGETICLDCLLEGRVNETEVWQRIDKPDEIKACQICGAPPATPMIQNQPMVDFINSISTGAYLK